MNFFISEFLLYDKKKIFANFIEIKVSGRLFPWHTEECAPPPINPEELFSDILAAKSRLNTLHGHETLYIISYRHLRIVF